MHLIRSDSVSYTHLDVYKRQTAACLECHETAATEMMQTTHWTWESEPVQLPGRDELVTVGKKNQLNNFCIGIQGNWTGCTSCHAGYGWEDATFDFAEQTNVCLLYTSRCV